MKTVFTAIFGEYDELKEPTVISKGWRYVCFTDQPFQSNVWQVVQKDIEDTPQQTARYYKIMNPYLYEMWIDASFTINCDLNEWWDKHFISPFTCVNHPIRDDFYEEGQACINHKRGDPVLIQKQINEYNEANMPRHAGLISSGILMRDYSLDLVKKFCLAWWIELNRQSLRDQLSFAYVEWKNGILWPRIKWDYRSRTEFQFLQHIPRRRKPPTVNPINE